MLSSTAAPYLLFRISLRASIFMMAAAAILRAAAFSGTPAAAELLKASALIETII